MAAKKKVARNVVAKSKPAKKKARGKAFPKLVPKQTRKRKKEIEKFVNSKQADPHPYAPKIGLPKKYETVEEFMEQADKYFEWIKGDYVVKKVKVPADNAKGYIVCEETECIRKPEPVTITGFALFMGFAGRSGLQKYKHDYPDFVYIVNLYCARVAHGYEVNLHGTGAVGSMFALKNIDNWQDRTDVFNDFSDNVVKGFNYLPPLPPNEPDINEMIK